MSSYTLWIRLKDAVILDKCVKHLGEAYNKDKSYKGFPTHITIVPSITSHHPNMKQNDIVQTVEKTVAQVKEELGKGKSDNKIHVTKVQYYNVVFLVF